MALSNYADRGEVDGTLAEHRLAFGADHRAYTPSDGEADEVYGALAPESHGDYGPLGWVWKPNGGQGVPRLRYQPDPGYEYKDPYDGMLAVDRRAELEALMPTYRPAAHPLHGIRPGA